MRSPLHAIVLATLAAVTLGLGAVTASCGGSSSVGFDGGSANRSSSNGSIDLAAGSEGGSLSYGDLPGDTAACPGNLPMPKTAPSDDASAACISIQGGVSGGGFDPCVPRASLTPSDLSSRCESDYAKQCGVTRYQVICACPEGTCACLRTVAVLDDGGDKDGGAFTSTHVVDFGTCPNCPDQDQALYALCGFPY